MPEKPDRDPSPLLATLRECLCQAIVPPSLHPRPEELAAYVARDLSGFLQDAVQRHLTFCRHCLPIVLDLTGGRGTDEEMAATGERHRRDHPRAPAPAAWIWTLETRREWIRTAARREARELAAKGSWHGLRGG